VQLKGVPLQCLDEAYATTSGFLAKFYLCLRTDRDVIRTRPRSTKPKRVPNNNVARGVRRRPQVQQGHQAAALDSPSPAVETPYSTDEWLRSPAATDFGSPTTDFGSPSNMEAGETALGAGVTAMEAGETSCTTSVADCIDNIDNIDLGAPSNLGAPSDLDDMDFAPLWMPQ